MPGYHKKRTPPLQTCPACGRKFRSWSKDRYCNNKECVDLRLYGPMGKPPA